MSAESDSVVFFLTLSGSRHVRRFYINVKRTISVIDSRLDIVSGDFYLSIAAVKY